MMKVNRIRNQTKVVPDSSIKKIFYYALTFAFILAKYLARLFFGWSL